MVPFRWRRTLLKQYSEIISILFEAIHMVCKPLLVHKVVKSVPQLIMSIFDG